jgi:hypothetical protein
MPVRWPLGQQELARDLLLQWVQTPLAPLLPAQPFRKQERPQRLQVLMALPALGEIVVLPPARRAQLVAPKTLWKPQV